MRRAAKVDSVQQEIVEGLRRCGYRVEIIQRPVDLLVKVGKNYWRLLEVKRCKRKDQPKQQTFIAETGVPVVATVEQALEALVS
ncbi:MAG: hypothetical protein WAN65_21070 [Candidatus Sulfotelmatobacter sp.]